MPPHRPIVFLAFADARNDLPGLRAEGWSLRDQFDELKRRGVLADVLVEEHASLDRLYRVFQQYRDRIALFHFGGHADGDHLLLQSALEPRAAGAGGLASLLGQQRGLKLVFLNGCSTRPQVQRLLDAGVPAVIATARPINDEVATQFAAAFYQALTTGGPGAGSGTDRGMAGGCCLDAAFAQAQALVKAARGTTTRQLLTSPPSHEDVTDAGGFPWSLQVRPGAESVARWNLFEHDPLFGLAGLPDDIGWPAEPYRSLEYFRREDARIFFGRGRAIRELYDLVTRPGGPAESPLIFYYGQTGVGKTSLLAVGLLPRLASLCDTRYLRRSAALGLLGTLREALAPATASFDLASAWQAIEARAKDARPLLLVLDQAEEAFTRPRPGVRPADEVRELFEAVHAAFAPTRPDRPRGRLILSFRKEWLAEFDEVRKALNLDTRPQMLDPLDRPGVIEAVQGPAAHYGLVIQSDRDSPPGGTTLAEYLADDMFDTLADPQTEQESPVAPTLQMLLTRMWKEATASRRLRGRPTFDRALYQELKGQGFKLDEVIGGQLDKIASRDGCREPAESGLLLDLLEYFTTRESTADVHTRQEVHRRYPHVPPDCLDALLEACQGSYLLAHVGVGGDGTAAYRLTHDTLAPLLRERARVSPAPAQRARRVLEGRAAGWTGKPGDPVLDRIDLALVEHGVPAMRALEGQEPALLAASRAAEARRAALEQERERQLQQARLDKERETALRLQEQRQANRRLARRAQVAAGAALAALAIAALAAVLGYQAHRQGERAREQKLLADHRAAVAESRRLAVLADGLRPTRLDLALLLALEANAGNTLEGRRSLELALDDRPEVARFLDIPESGVRSVAFGPNGALAAGCWRGTAGSVVFLDDQGRRTRDAPAEVPEGGVVSVAFGPDGALAAAYRRDAPGGGVVLFDGQGQRLWPAPAEVKEGWVTSVAFGPGGTIAAGYEGNGGGVVFLDRQGQRRRNAPVPIAEGNVRSLAFGPDGTLAVGYARDERGGVVLLDSQGQRPREAPVEVQEGVVVGLAFDPAGRLAAAYQGGSSGVALLDERGQRLWQAPCETPGSRAAGVAAGPGGTVALAYYLPGQEVRGGVLLLDAKGRRRFNAPVPEGGVHGLAFGPDGRLAAGYGRLAGEGGVLLLQGTGPHPRFDPARPRPAAVGNPPPEAGATAVGSLVPPTGAGARLRLAAVTLPQGAVKALAAGPQGALAAVTPRALVLLDRTGRPLRTTPAEVPDASFTSIAFGPEGTLAAGYAGPGDGGGAVLLDAAGQPRRGEPIPIPEGRVRSIAFGPGGTLAAGYDRDRGGGVVLLEGTAGARTGHIDIPEGWVKGLAFGPAGTLAVGYSAGIEARDGNGVVLLDAAGKRLGSTPVAVTEGWVTAVAIGPGGCAAVGYSTTGLRGSVGGVVLLDAAGRRRRDAPVPVEEGFVHCLAYGPDGHLAAGYKKGFTGGVVIFDSAGERLRDAPIETREGSVTALAWDPDGTLAAAWQGVSDSGLVLLDGRPASWRARAARVVNRNFTWAEWGRFFPDTPYRRTVGDPCPWPSDLPARERRDAEAREKDHPPVVEDF